MHMHNNNMYMYMYMYMCMCMCMCMSELRSAPSGPDHGCSTGFSGKRRHEFFPVLVPVRASPVPSAV